MPDDKHHIQMRISPKLREQIQKLADQNRRSTANIARTALVLGMRILGKLLEAQSEMVTEYIELLKNQRFEK